MNISSPSHVIAIETSSDVCSVAAFSDETLLQELRIEVPRSHAKQLVPMMEQLLHESLDGRVDVIAVSAGPGSFTGLRIGVSSAKGLAFARMARIVSIPTLEAIASGFLTSLKPTSSSHEQTIIVVSPSRKEELYCAMFKGASGNYPERILDETSVEMVSFENLVVEKGIKQGQVVLSSPIPEFEELLENNPAFTVRISKPSAVNVGYCALQKVVRGEFEDTSTFEPYYLKKFQAKKPRLSALDRLSF